MHVLSRLPLAVESQTNPKRPTQTNRPTQNIADFHHGEGNSAMFPAVPLVVEDAAAEAA